MFISVTTSSLMIIMRFVKIAFFCSFTQASFLSWRRRQHISSKHKQNSTRLHGSTSQKTVIFIVTATGTPNLANIMGAAISDTLTAADKDSDFLKSESASILNIYRRFERRYCLYLQSKIAQGEYLTGLSSFEVSITICQSTKPNISGDFNFGTCTKVIDKFQTFGQQKTNGNI